MNSSTTAPIAIRLATAEDRVALTNLAVLDDAPLPFGRVLVATLGDELVAVQPLEGGRAFADPFRPTAEIVQLLELRARQIPDSRPTRRFHLPAFHGRGRALPAAR
jgi:hypothetical protein